jgi:hypothetical protein
MWGSTSDMLDLVIGRRELGKTTLAVYLAKQFDRRVIFDPRHMISTTAVILSDVSDGQLYEALQTHHEIIVRPHFAVEETFAAMCEEIYYWLLDHPAQRFALLVDECRFIREPEKDRFFDYIVRCTKRNQVTVILTCHGVIDISTDLRRVADFWILFQITMELDLERVYERCGPVVANEVQKLKPYEFIVWDDAHRLWWKRTDAETWYVPLEPVTVNWSLAERTA